MGTFLDKLGIKLFALKWWVIGFWLAVLVITGIGAAFFYKAPSSAVSIPGTEAQVALDRLTELFPGSGKASGNIVFHTTDQKVSAFKSAIDAGLGQVKAVPGVVTVISPFVNPQAMSSDGKTAYALVQLQGETGQIDASTLGQIAAITSKLNTQGLQVEQGGGLVNAAPTSVLGITEGFGVLIALAVLVITLGALIAAGMPLLVALLGVGVSVAGLFALSSIIDISWTTPVLSIMLGLAVGIDYSLFIIAKYRSLLLEGYSYSAAAGRAIGTAGNAVIFAAATVVLALAALSVVGIPFLTTMGLAGAATIAMMAIIAITITPALFAVSGTKMFGRKAGEAIAAAQQRRLAVRNSEFGIRNSELSSAEAIPHSDTFWDKWGRALTKRPWVALVLAIVVVGVMAIPVPSLALGLPSDEYAAPATTQKKAYDLMTDAFGVGYNTPLVAVVSNVPPVTDEDRAATRSAVTAAFQQQASAQGLTVQQRLLAQAQVEGQIAQYSNLAELNKIATHIATVDDVQSATPAMVTADGTSGIIQIIPKSAPYDPATTGLITYLRDNQAAAAGNPKVSLAITGATALQLDISKKLSDALPVYLLVVVGLSLLLLLVAFRSLLIPIKATLGFLLSVLAMFGAMIAVFQQGLFGFANPAPLVNFLPIIGIGILFGLAMDYEFFLVSSMHEAYRKTGDPKRAIETGFSHGARVVTAAAVIMIAVFASFIGHDDATIQTLGFGLAVGIFVDAFLVRMTLVPAVMTLLGKSAWWLPKWLDKILPNISIEGEPEEEPIEEGPGKEVPQGQVDPLLG